MVLSSYLRNLFRTLVIGTACLAAAVILPATCSQPASAADGGRYNPGPTTSGLASSVPWDGITGKPAPITAVSDSGYISLTSLTVGQVTGTSLISTAAAGTVSASKLYGGNVSATTGTISTLSSTLAAGPQNNITALGGVTDVTMTGTLTGPTLISTSAGGTISGTEGRFKNVSTTNATVTGEVSGSAPPVSGALVFKDASGRFNYAIGAFYDLTSMSLVVSNTISATSFIGSGVGLTGVTASPGGPSGSIQFNNAGSVSGSTNFVTHNNNVGVATVTPTAKFEVTGAISASSINVTGTTGTISATNGYITTSSGTTTSYTHINGRNLSGTLITGATVSGTAGNFLTISATNINFTSSTAVAGQMTYLRAIPSGGITLDGGAGCQYHQPTNRFICGENDLTANVQPSASVHVSGTFRATSYTAIGFNTTPTVPLAVSGTTSTTTIREGIVVQAATTSTTTINFAAASYVSTTITTNTTIAFSNYPTGAMGYVLAKFCQDGTGGRTINYPVTARFSGNLSPTLTTTANTCSFLAFTATMSSVTVLVTSPATGVSP